jgi:hypothetical protein
LDADDDKVIVLPSVEELLADPKRHIPPELRAEASRPFESRREGPPRPAPPPVQPVASNKPDPAAPPPGSGPEDYDAEGGDYKAFGWAGNQPQPTLIIILKDGTELGFNYADLATACQGGSMFLRSAPGFKGNVVRLLFHGDDGLFVVLLGGVVLRHVWGLLMRHKTPWVHELPEGAEAVPGEPVIRSITFQKIERQRAAGKDGR